MHCCHNISRREFMNVSVKTSMVVGMGLSRPVISRQNDGWDPDKPFVRQKSSFRVQPVLMYRVAYPKKERSWNRTCETSVLSKL